MRSRDTNLDQFSTFAFLQGDRVRHWLPEPRLRRNMRKYLMDAQAPDEGVPDSTWAIYWYKIWQAQQDDPPEPKPNIAFGPAVSQRIAQQHLAAYLQEVCYWTAQKTALRFPQLEFTLADYFQINSGETARVLKSFNPQFGSPLKGYASIVLTNLLKDHLRQRRAIDVCSDTSLLRKMSQKRITEILTHAGVTAGDLEEYRFAWVCFKTIVVPGDGPVSETDKGQQTDQSLWTAVADLYNSKRRQQLSPTAPQITAEQLEARLMKVTRWSRAYLYPTVDSLNKTKPGQEKGEIQDSIADPVATSLLDAAIEAETDQERQQQRSQLQATLLQSLNQLDGMAQELLRLFYQDRLSQQELALNMKMSQPTVSRRLKKAEETLLTKMIGSVKGSVNNLPEPSELRHISIALKECLESHYRP
jgi:RNA polymerase sigma factor (sigma-70 family)